MSGMRSLAFIAVLVALTCALYLSGVAFDWYGELESSGRVQASRTPAAVIEERTAIQRQAAGQHDPGGEKQILFGDLHVHTTFSSDAFRMSLPMVQGDGAHPPADACDFARICSALDFWALTDHAESLTRDRWNESIASVQQCNAVAGDSSNPDLVTFMGFEWTQAGPTPDRHYGHKNVIFKETEEDTLPTRPIGSPFREAFSSIPLNLRLLPPLRDWPNRQRYYDFGHLIQTISRQEVCADDVHVRDLPADCSETAPNPAVLFRKLDEWDVDSIVIPHGTAWGVYTPAGSSWDKQLQGGMHDPQRQTLIEVYSGHGNSEEYRDWRAVEIDASGGVVCPEPRSDYLPSCWQAGELIRQRCVGEGLAAEECEQHAAQAREQYLAYGQVGWHTVPGTTILDWLDAGQCQDCFLPAFNYRPGSSAQYILALSNFDSGDEPGRFRFGFIASSDNHSARPGTGFKQRFRDPMTDWWGYGDAESRALYSTDRGEPGASSVSVDAASIDLFNILEMERQASFFLTGGLVAVHSEGRDRDAIWQALKRKEVYGTSGPRILLWFDLLNPPGGQSGTLGMGTETEMNEAPRFSARALGAFRQNPGCPESNMNAVSAERLELLCRNECFNPSDERLPISRIDVIRIRPQASPGEAVAPLIEDPWLSFDCSDSSKPDEHSVCEFEFTDPDFESGARDTVYYVRAVQQEQATINAGNLRCEEDVTGQCIEINPCYGDDRTDPEDDCLDVTAHRAWSSPIFVDYLPPGNAVN